MTQSINNNISIIENNNSCIEIEELDCSIPHIPNCNETQFHSCFPSGSLPQNLIDIPVRQRSSFRKSKSKNQNNKNKE